MLMQLSNVQNFVNNYLADVVDWRKHVLQTTDPSLRGKIEREYVRETTGDQAHVIIQTEYNRYYLSAASMYVEPPHGAPIECKMLGTIIFEELTADEPVRMVRARQDQTFIDIAKQVRKSELKGCIKDVRRQLAECNDDENKKILLGRLPMLTAKAKEYGLSMEGLPVPSPDLVMPMPTIEVGEAIKQMQDGKQHFKRAEEASHHVEVTPIPSDLYVGAPVIYITNPGEAVGGQREIPGICNKVYAGDILGGVFFPDHSEVMHKDRIYRRTEKIRANCWDFNPDYLAVLAKQKLIDNRNDDLIRRIEAVESQRVEKAVDDGMDKLASRISELDQATKAVIDAELAPVKAAIEELRELMIKLASHPALTGGPLTPTNPKTSTRKP